ncbi:hypothetical protein LCGC14_0610640 [marine sediment metagenome]|uniref:Uncharacterized protein n=1 Tax=marine sediment metagenome TaxID=412755 RepID=A0A0F9RCD7_9ZZZZ
MRVSKISRAKIKKVVKFGEGTWESVLNVELTNYWNMIISYPSVEEGAIQLGIFNYYARNVIEVKVIKFKKYL